MFRGHFDLTLMDAPGYTAEDFERARRKGEMDALLAKLPVVQRAETNNRLFDNLAGYVLYNLFQVGNCGWPYYLADEGPEAALTSICLLSTSDDTLSYTEDWGVDNTYSYMTIHDVPDSINTSNAGKIFIQNQATTYLIDKQSGGREGIYFRNRFTYIPGEATGSIRSIGIYYSSNGSQGRAGSYYRAAGRIGRVRLKDPGGNPITLSKGSGQVLMVEYTMYLVSY